MTVGIDARLTSVGSLYDLNINLNGDIESEDFFDTAIIISLFAEKRANESEVLNPLLRRGWIGNEVTPGFEIGSKIWLYEQSRLTNSVLNGITTAARQALQWLVDDGFAVSIDDVEAIITKTGINLTVIIRRPNSKVEKRHYTLWDNTGISIVAPQTYFYISSTGIETINLFDVVGKPGYPVTVFFDVRTVMNPHQTSPIFTGGPWHLDSDITINIISGTGSVIGGGGDGGVGGSTSGNGGIGGGGGGGGSFGFGGLSEDGLRDGDDGDALNGGNGGSGVGVGGVASIAAQNGDDGYSAIVLEHDVTVVNNGTLYGGAGGGGGGGADGGDGGKGANTAADNAADGTGASPGSGGVIGAAIETNGHTATLSGTGLTIGSVT